MDDEALLGSVTGSYEDLILKENAITSNEQRKR